MPNQRAKPTLRRRRLGALLRDCRNKAGQTLEEASTRMGWDDHTKLSKIENARAHLPQKDVAPLLSGYGVTDESLITAIAGLARDAGKAGWWAPYGDTLANAYTDYISIESDAVGVRFYAPTVMPGLLQVAPYAREVIAATTTRTPEEIEARVNVRLARQSVLSRPNPLKFYAVINEEVLRHEFPNNPEAMREQLRHLLYLSDRPHITIQVMPTPVASHPGLLGLFNLVEFPPPWPPLVQLESIRGGSFMEDRSDVKVFENAFERIVAAALPTDTSREVIKTILEEKYS
ncbi:helix-turn-helix domain-containing protein [Streptomyces sp. NA04227]|uniref:helix-turn-helix domain-containing protein n=1 Tax=Streptomyces sp. NA04227 TaxID=2742136 RepID=UPI001592A1FF|nr:helix-turn-helix transcriptional regulator [Streptomyces sp. NA04227]QKW08309.1 helix-turn-helix domain-containing protein [Streptomyces sp. NA04227]